MGATRGHVCDLEWTYHSTTTSPEIPYFEPKIGLINQAPQYFVARTNFFLEKIFVAQTITIVPAIKEIIPEQKIVIRLFVMI